jgi:Spy/CpxP family protein refolding chaperone
MPARPVLVAALLVVLLALTVAAIAWSRSNPSGPAGRTTGQTSAPPSPGAS